MTGSFWLLGFTLIIMAKAENEALSAVLESTNQFSSSLFQVKEMLYCINSIFCKINIQIKNFNY